MYEERNYTDRRICSIKSLMLLFLTALESKNGRLVRLVQGYVTESVHKLNLFDCGINLLYGDSKPQTGLAAAVL